MAKDIGGRSALTAPQRGEPTRADRSAGKAARPTRAGIDLRAETDDPDDRGDDAIAMRENPTGQSEDRERDRGGARKRRAQPEEDRAAKRVGEARERRSGKSRVEQFHRRNDNRREQHRGAYKERGAAPARRRGRRKRSIRRRVAAEPQAVQRDCAGDDGRERHDDAARVVDGDVVVARVRDQIVGNDVDRAVRRHGSGSSSSDDQCDERARGDGH